MEIGKGEFSDSSIDRVAETEDRVVGFADSSPVVVFLVESDYVVKVRLGGLEIEQERPLAMEGERSSCDEGTLDAVSSSVAERHPRR